MSVASPQPDIYPGNCWAFRGSQGYLVVRLSMTIRPTAFTLEHIPKTLSPTGSITSAPKDFAVYVSAPKPRDPVSAVWESPRHEPREGCDASTLPASALGPPLCPLTSEYPVNMEGDVPRLFQGGRLREDSPLIAQLCSVF